MLTLLRLRQRTRTPAPHRNSRTCRVLRRPLETAMFQKGHNRLVGVAAVDLDRHVIAWHTAGSFQPVTKFLWCCLHHKHRDTRPPYSSGLVRKSAQPRTRNPRSASLSPPRAPILSQLSSGGPACASGTTATQLVSLDGTTANAQAYP